jgi:AcrR family transcriptional regulator
VPTSTTRKAGRPRDDAIDQTALATTLQLLGEVGFEGTTIQAVAARSGLHASALYRRWSSRIELIEDAMTPLLVMAPLEPTGDLRRDVRRLVRAYVAAWSTPAARAAIPGLLAHYQSAGTRSAAEWLPISARPQFIDILRAAPAGTVDPTVDPDDVFDVLLGAALVRALVPTVVERHRPVERTVDLVVKMLEPRPNRVVAAR